MYLIKNSFGSHTVSLTHYSVNCNCHGCKGALCFKWSDTVSFDEKNTKAFLYMLKTIVHSFPDPALRGEFLLYR